MNTLPNNTIIALVVALVLGAWMWWTTGAFAIPFTDADASDTSIATTTVPTDL
jgi:hypothetical protein